MGSMKYLWDPWNIYGIYEISMGSMKYLWDLWNIYEISTKYQCGLSSQTLMSIPTDCHTFWLKLEDMNARVCDLYGSTGVPVRRSQECRAFKGAECGECKYLGWSPQFTSPVEIRLNKNVTGAKRREWMGMGEWDYY